MAKHKFILKKFKSIKIIWNMFLEKNNFNKIRKWYQNN